MGETMDLTTCTQLREELYSQLQERLETIRRLVERWFAEPDGQGRLAAEREWAEARALLAGMPSLIAEATRREAVAFLEVKAAQVGALSVELARMKGAAQLFGATEVRPAEVKFLGIKSAEEAEGGGAAAPCSSEACRSARAAYESRRAELDRKIEAIDGVTDTISAIGDEIRARVGSEILVRPGVVEKSLMNSAWRESAARQAAKRAHDDTMIVVQNASVGGIV